MNSSIESDYLHSMAEIPLTSTYKPMYGMYSPSFNQFMTKQWGFPEMGVPPAIIHFIDGIFP